jgi:hypothetical protein
MTSPDSSFAPPPESDTQGQPSLLQDRLAVRVFLIGLAGLLVGYMFFGRGFAHIGFGPIYIGDWMMLLGLAVAAFVVIRSGARAPVTLTVGMLLAFAALGAVRMLPYIGTYGIDALRDGTVWGYSAFALLVYLLVDRTVALNGYRLYGWVVPIFALWLPISWNLFKAASIGTDSTRPGSFVPLVFFKGGDMAVHTVGAIALLVLGAGAVWSARSFGWRMLLALPLLWTVFVAGTSNRGALLTAVAGVVVIAVLARRARSWLPFFGAVALFVVAGLFQAVVGQPSAPAASATTAGTSSPGEPKAAVPLTVANPGFELGPLNDGTIQDWTIRAAGPHEIVAGGAHRGTRYASIQNVAGAYEDTITSDRFAFGDGPDIGVSAWVKAVAAEPILDVYVNWYDSSRTFISSTHVGALKTHGVDAWQEYTGVQVAPAHAAQAELKFFEGSGMATMGIDEVTARSGDLIPKPVPPKGRPATIQQMIDNLMSIFSSSSDGGLEGSKQFRLAWWGTIIDYTLFGKYFWTGKGFGVNLADADGFQSTMDHSLRSPHNTNVTVLARMGVPGLILWLLLQGAFGIGLVRAMLAHRRAGDVEVAVLAALLVAYWVAMLVDTSFDPYLEGPQGGIWFWVIFGLGLVVMRLSPERRATS